MAAILVPRIGQTVDMAAIRQRPPGLICLEASWFGGEGPYVGFAAIDSTVRALASLIKQVGPVQGPPLHERDDVMLSRAMENCPLSVTRKCPLLG